MRLFLRKPPALQRGTAAPAFVPLYVSKEVVNAANPEWAELADLQVRTRGLRPRFASKNWCAFRRSAFVVFLWRSYTATTFLGTGV